MTKNNSILIKGARVNNLKNIDVEIPRNKLVVITGLSGSGKSSLAFDTLYAEGQRRYVESLSSYARQFLGRMSKPECDFIKGIPPAIAIEQKVSSRNPRSTVGTSTEIYEYLRLLYARIGRTFSPISGEEIKFDKPFTTAEVWSGNKIIEGKKEVKGNHVGAILGFKTNRNEKIGVKVSSSFINEEQAWLNLEEIGSKDFNMVKEAARHAWNDAMNKVRVEGGTDEQYRTFYSCLYRSLLFPRKFYEIDKSGSIVHYSPYNGEIKNGYMYTDTGFWDTFRALFPFLNLMYPSVSKEVQESLVNAYKESGFLPEWASPGHRHCMVGNNSASVVADAYLKGCQTKDINLLYEAVLHGANNVHPQVPSTGRLGYEYYNSLGYIPYNVGINENVARTLFLNHKGKRTIHKEGSRRRWIE